ncbi:MAG: hypothetical protein WCL28_14460 [bacterium]
MDYVVFVIVDDVSWPVPILPGLRIVAISDQESIASGFLGVNPAILKPLPVSAWDKALCEIHRSPQFFSNIWLIEDDVFIPSPSSLQALDLDDPTADLLAAPVNIITATTYRPFRNHGWSWFRHVPFSLLPLPLAHGMVCAIRLSHRLALDSAQFVQNHSSSLDRRNRLLFRLSVLLRRLRLRPDLIYRFFPPHYLFIEYLFPTLAVHRGYVISTLEPLSTILWRHEWEPEAMLPTHLYHPMKVIADHPRLREQMAQRQS